MVDALSAPAQGALSVTPSDSADLSIRCRSLYVGGAGNVAVTMSDGSEVTFTGVTAGSVLPIRVKRVKATNTTATTILALY